MMDKSCVLLAIVLVLRIQPTDDQPEALILEVHEENPTHPLSRSHNHNILDVIKQRAQPPGGSHWEALIPLGRTKNIN